MSCVRSSLFCVPRAHLSLLGAALSMLAGPAWAQGAEDAADAVDRSSYGRTFDQLQQLGIPRLHACGLSGKGVTVAVLDTGFDLRHRAFEGLKVAAQYDFVQGDAVTADEEGDVPGQDTHGTEVLSLLAGKETGQFSGIAPAVTVLLAKVDALPNDSVEEDNWWVQGLQWAKDNGATIVTTSVGYCGSGRGCRAALLDGKTEVTTRAAVAAVAEGLMVFGVAGNEGPTEMTIDAPGDGDGVLSIGSVDPWGRVASDSSRGPTWDGRIKPDLMAPGVSLWVVDPSSTSRYQRASGTSLATPLAAGVAALLAEAFPSKTAAELRALLKRTANRHDAPDNSYGWGLIDGIKAAGLRCSCVDQDADGHFATACGGDDCDDQSSEVYPDAPESCDGVDNNCDGMLSADEMDGDGDGQLDCLRHGQRQDAVGAAPRNGEMADTSDGCRMDGDGGGAPGATIVLLLIGWVAARGSSRLAWMMFNRDRR